MAHNDRYFQTNKENWNQRVDVHSQSEFYNLQEFKKGKSSLNPYEIEALDNVQGKSLLHLQCHFGLDTLSWRRRGAKVVGLDFSEEAIKLARALNQEMNLDAEFVCCNVLDTSKHVKELFDVVFTSYGVIGWLPDLKAWGKMIAERLTSKGVFYIVEFHPIVWMFDYQQTPPKLKYGYMQDEVIYEEYKGTYANKEAEITSKEYGWNHGLGEIVNSLTEAGLFVEYLKEYDESPYNIIPDLVKTKSGMFSTKEKLYPLIFSLKATKL